MGKEEKTLMAKKEILSISAESNRPENFDNKEETKKYDQKYYLDLINKQKAISEGKGLKFTENIFDCDFDYENLVYNVC